MYTISGLGVRDARSATFLSTLGEMFSGRHAAVIQNLLSKAPQNVDLPFQ